jgi:outer membrane protein TolC
MADLSMQWLICDFGRRYGRYRQAGIGIHIAEEQAARAYQTVANEVSVAYYEVLRARALVRTARDAVRRSQDDVDVARKLEQGGVVEKEKRLRVEVQLAQSLRALDETEGAEAIATAALNYAVGLNVNAATDIEEASDIPPFTKTLEEFLRTAVAQRHEFIVAQETIHLSDEGRRVAQADFAPRVFAAGTFANLDNQHPHGYGDALIGSINLQWTIFEGGRRVAELRIADSRIREAIAQAQSIADTIAYQVTVAYEQVTTSRAAIEHSRPAVDQAEENQRLVVARAKVGDATSSDITDAESTLTRAQQEYLNSIHDYLIALARLDYATGVTMAPRAVRAAGRSAAADEVGSRTIERSGTER